MAPRAWRQDVGLFSQIVGAVAGMLLIFSALTNTIAELSTEMRQALTVIGLLVLGYGASFGLYRVARWAQGRTLGAVQAVSQELPRQVRLYPLVLELQAIGRALHDLVIGAGDDSLYTMMNKVHPPQSITNLYLRTIREQEGTKTAKLRALTFGDLSEPEIAEAAKTLLGVLRDYGQFLDEYRTNVALDTAENQALFAACLEGYNHVTRHLQRVMPELESALGSYFRAEGIGTKAR